MNPKIPGETAEQKQQRERAEAENTAATQETLADRTRQYRRLRSPRLSIASARSVASMPIMR